jgi:hypothetical protein
LDKLTLVAVSIEEPATSCKAKIPAALLFDRLVGEGDYRAFDKALRRSWPTRAVFRNMSGILTFKGLCKILHPARYESKQDRRRIAKARRVDSNDDVPSG